MPHASDRLSVRRPGKRLPLATQSWENVLFLHWKVPPRELAKLLPGPLALDLHEGEAWVGLVLLTVLNVSPVLGVPLPWLSDFHQANLRTYVHLDGVPGIWFFSTDSDSALAVSGLRKFFHLPYYKATCHQSRDGRRLRFESHRRDPSGADVSVVWHPTDHIGQPIAGTTEFFLLERYYHYAADGGKLYRGKIFHHPWDVHRAHITRFQSTIVQAQSLPAPAGMPMAHYASRMENVRVWPMEEV
ncbi:YqjF family protein [Geobacter sp. DSM 9736]|uniref:YqjF family protein n=1 Tax=Geobacter sp. DSM 9736 TaxID=1277350 RepID=UPI0012FD1490|nr:DUF2071 domain-containing protein [Geobacter sp. DSM 9736]